MEADVTSSKKMKLDISFSIEDDLMNNSMLPNINDYPQKHQVMNNIIVIIA